MKKRWASLCVALVLLWALAPGAGAAGAARESQTGHSIIGIETIGVQIPEDWYVYTVTVMEETGKRLEGVVLRLCPVLPDGSHGSAITGMNGQYMTGEDGRQTFLIPPPGGTYQLKTEFSGYEDYDSGALEINADGELVVVLKKQQSKPPATGDSAGMYGYALACVVSAVLLAASLAALLERRRREAEQR